MRRGLALDGGVLAKTDRTVVYRGVAAPILSYNSAIAAQVFATLGYIFQEEFF
jgi:hypothetical protein